MTLFSDSPASGWHFTSSGKLYHQIDWQEVKGCSWFSEFNLIMYTGGELSLFQVAASTRDPCTPASSQVARRLALFSMSIPHRPQRGQTTSSRATFLTGTSPLIRVPSSGPTCLSGLSAPSPRHFSTNCRSSERSESPTNTSSIVAVMAFKMAWRRTPTAEACVQISARLERCAAETLTAWQRAVCNCLRASDALCVSQYPGNFSPFKHVYIDHTLHGHCVSCD